MIEILCKIMLNYPVDMSMSSCYTADSFPNSSDTIITMSSEDAIRQLLIGKSIGNTVCGKLFKKDLFKSIRFSEDNSDTLIRLIELSKKVGFINTSSYLCNNIEGFSRSSIINRDIRTMKLYPSLEVYCQYDILKNLQNEFYECFCNNSPLINSDNMYKMFMQIVKEKEDKISPFLSYNRKAHMYLLANDYSSYKRICPVLPDLDLTD